MSSGPHGRRKDSLLDSLLLKRQFCHLPAPAVHCITLKPWYERVLSINEGEIASHESGSRGHGHISNPSLPVHQVDRQASPCDRTDPWQQTRLYWEWHGFIRCALVRLE